ncbi:MAG: hypothetical protein CL529_11995 [Aequorivita sp.]|nr:hypothetical protein [Aequorivita sp.]|tara:strand:+ start:31363 stop:31605 length:243 start_codon:yes stop_codon:yes gene_type:complete
MGIILTLIVLYLIGYSLFSSNDLGAEYDLVYGDVFDEDEPTDEELIDEDLMERIKPLWELSPDKYNGVTLKEYYEARFSR